MRKTNDEFVSDLMNYGGPTGPLSQAFIIEAIGRYAQQVAAAPAIPDSAFLSGEAWKKTGEWIHAQMQERLK